MGDERVEGFRRRLNLTLSNAKLMRDLKSELRSTTFLNKTKEEKNRLIRWGLLVLASPDPFTDPIAWGLILAGVIKEKRRTPTVHDIPLQLRRSIQELAAMNRELSNLRL